ncbi:hypothetical protein GQ600_7524 [Phytophthora cactorum]|nr:hypothetical protein GQ600_7524 [Phytophthora cactorum]
MWTLRRLNSVGMTYRVLSDICCESHVPFQKDDRDYTKLDNTTVYTLGRRLPETLTESPLLAIDGTAWTKSRSNKTSSQPATTPYGYLYTPDCRGIVDSSCSRVDKYQAYMGDGLGNCAFRDSQETELQTLCRLFMTSDEVLFRDLDGTSSTCRRVRR